MLQRTDGSVNFRTKLWADMKAGFEGSGTEFFMGLELLNQKCGRSGTCELYVFMTP